jgi:polyhydroxybutyrate depolymerase
VVEHYKVIGGGHSWPGAAINLNVTNMDFRASDEVWRFFRKFTLEGLNNINDQNISLFHTYPNPASGVINLKFDNFKERRITIYTATGQIVEDLVCDKSEREIYLNAKGLLIVHVSSKDGKQIAKIINY